MRYGKGLSPCEGSVKIFPIKTIEKQNELGAKFTDKRYKIDEKMRGKPEICISYVARFDFFLIDSRGACYKKSLPIFNGMVGIPVFFYLFLK